MWWLGVSACSMPNAAVDCWGILLIQNAPYRGIWHLVAQCEGGDGRHQKIGAGAGQAEGTFLCWRALARGSSQTDAGGSEAGRRADQAGDAVRRQGARQPGGRVADLP